MLRFLVRFWICSYFTLLLSSCATAPKEQDLSYSREAALHLYQLQQWSFSGRLALTGKEDSWSANIVWEHDYHNEKIKLSGPLGQGATVIRLTDEFVSIDRGDGRAQSSAQPEAFINQQLGLSVPVQSLRYWVVGLPEPVQAFTLVGNGFEQSGWLVEYKQMNSVEKQRMPYRVTVMNDRVKLKLIIDQWVLDDAQGK